MLVYTKTYIHSKIYHLRKKRIEIGHIWKHVSQKKCLVKKGSKNKK